MTAIPLTLTMSVLLASTSLASIVLAAGVIVERDQIPLQVEGEPTPKRFVLRYPESPESWNGGLVVGAHGGRGGETYHRDGRVSGTDETSLDDVVGDHAVSLGFAYASVDRDGIGGSRTGLAVTKEFTERMKERLAERLGRDVDRTYLVGLSMGGGIARYAAEESLPAYDGVLIIVGAGGDTEAQQLRRHRMADVWPQIGALGSERYAAVVGTPQAASRFWPFMARSSLAMQPSTAASSAALPNTTGRVTIPTIEVAGTFDDFVYPEILLYREKVRAAGASSRHRLYSVEGAWHLSPEDDAVESFQFIGSRMGLGKAELDAMATGASYLAAARGALELLDRWVAVGAGPPPSRDLAPGESPRP